MSFTHLTVLGTVASALAMWFLGALWYSPVAFGPAWMKSVGLSKEKLTANAQNAMWEGAVASFVQAVALGVLLSLFHPSSLQEALEICLAAWVALQLPIWLHQRIYEQRPLELLLISGGYGLVSILLAGVIVQLAA
ncbi:MAG: DUF1761 domain-containing protein [Candidatus Peribacteraceae bacterium]|nr:DUF1761 domain-containing protein [Candidatus Peribacteraceae bacterium]